MKDLMKRQVSQQLKKIKEIKFIKRPSLGWIHTIREALGMTTQQLALRLGVIQQRVSTLEKAEKNGSVKLKTLEEAAHALNCKLVYYFIPNEPLEAMLKDRAYFVAKKRIEHGSHSMDLEEQPISGKEKQIRIEELAKELLSRHSKELWDE